MNKCFVDSNIWVYSFSGDDDPRGAAAREFIGNAAANTELFISYQVINETARVLKKRGHSEIKLRQIIDNMFAICDVCGFTQNGAMLASELRETMSISYWDSHIAANAILAGCDTLVSEDLQDGAFIRGVQVKNIFGGITAD
jgi:predicted nucleic acid-binding protein